MDRDDLIYGFPLEFWENDLPPWDESVGSSLITGLSLALAPGRRRMGGQKKGCGLQPSLTP
jgi:hypothetical protein